MFIDDILNYIGKFFNYQSHYGLTEEQVAGNYMSTQFLYTITEFANKFEIN